MWRLETELVTASFEPGRSRENVGLKCVCVSKQNLYVSRQCTHTHTHTPLLGLIHMRLRRWEGWPPEAPRPYPTLTPPSDGA